MFNYAFWLLLYFIRVVCPCRVYLLWCYFTVCSHCSNLCYLCVSSTCRTLKAATGHSSTARGWVAARRRVRPVRSCPVTSFSLGLMLLRTHAKVRACIELICQFINKRHSRNIKFVKFLCNVIQVPQESEGFPFLYVDFSWWCTNNPEINFLSLLLSRVA